MISRQQAELARDHALNARATVAAHADECRTCSGDTIPCELGGMLQRGASKISREAHDALAAYLPVGSQVTYNGHRAEYQGRTWIVAGLSRRAPWSSYILVGPGVAPFTATLPSLQLSTREAQQREQLDQVRRAVAACLAVMAKQGINILVHTDRSDTGIVRVTWSSAEYIGAETRAQQVSDTEAGQYLAAALYLLQALRAHTQRRAWEEVKRDAYSAGKLAERAGVRAQA
ncbi:hypothetical protein ACQP25_17070 [Microtetraspora malaysiensis]|uniref:hypothetical protein n=1 Tax=Microtetraspora malaysiensis TaxID=161358 RepID=UPI003D8AEB7A